jgi:hypothetical protein
MSGYGALMLRLIAKLLVLAAVLAMPFGMGQAAAAPPAAHHAAMPMQRCPDPEQGHHKKGGIVECTMACAAALPATDFADEQPLLIACSPIEAASPHVLHGLHPDTATPPPKRA